MRITPTDSAIARGLCASVLFMLAALPGLAGDWNPKLAAQYLDSRQKEWFAWTPAKIYGGPCISCHTGVTYLLARPALRRVLGEAEPTAYETGLKDALLARAGIGLKDALKAQKEPAASQGIGVESIFAALFLNPETPAAQQAWDRLWSMQFHEGPAKGSWPWFDFDTDPYETADSGFFGASLAALAISATPPEYQARPEIKERVAELDRVSSDSDAGAAPAQSPAAVVGSGEAARRRSGRETIHHRRDAEKAATRRFVDDRGSGTVEGPSRGATRQRRECIRHGGRCLCPGTGGCSALGPEAEQGPGLASLEAGSAIRLLGGRLHEQAP